jgi:hypothetical protein
MASFAMAYAMTDLSWKFYFINAAWDFIFLIVAYFTFVETKGLTLEEVNIKFEGTLGTVNGIADDSSSQDIEPGNRKGVAIEKAQELS